MSALDALLPASALIRREFLTSLRLIRHFVIAMLVALIVAWIGFANLPDASNLSAMRAWSNEFLIMTVMTLALAAAFSVPAMAGSAVSTEYEEQTMELLTCTFARPWTCLLAKFVCSAGLYVLLLIAAMPAMAMVYFAAGVDLDALLRCVAVILSWVASATAAGLLCSVWIRRPAFALGAAYGAALLLSGLQWILSILVLTLVGLEPSFAIFPYVAAVVTPMTLVFILEPSGSALLFGAVSPNAGHIFVHLSLAVLFFVLACRRLDYDWRHGRGPVAAKRTVTRFRRERHASTVRDLTWLSPIVFKDAICELRLFGRPGAMLWGAVFLVSGAATAILFFLKLSEDSDYDEALKAWMALQSWLMMIVAPTLSAHLFGKEQARETLDGLRMTLLTDWQIVTGKARAALTGGLVIVSASVAAALPLCLLPKQFDAEWFVIGAALTMIGVTTTYALAVGLLSSALTPRLGAALTVSFCALFLAPIGAIVVVEELTGAANSEYLAPFVAPLPFLFLGSVGAYEIRHIEELVASYIVTLLFAAACFALCLPAYRWRYGGRR